MPRVEFEHWSASDRVALIHAFGIIGNAVESVIRHAEPSDEEFWKQFRQFAEAALQGLGDPHPDLEELLILFEIGGRAGMEQVDALAGLIEEIEEIGDDCEGGG